MFTKQLQNATVSFVMSVHIEQLGSYWTDLLEILYWGFLLKAVH
jgi:hypothetical protein